MSERRGAKKEAQSFTIDQLQDDRPRVVDAARKSGGAIVVDNQGQRRFRLSIPQDPLASNE